MSHLAAPWPPPIASQRFRLSSNTGFFRSPLTGQMQTLTRPGGIWQFDVQFEVLDDVRLAAWMGFLAQAQEEAATFYWNNYPKAVPINYPTGTGFGAPLVNGATQSGRSLICDGFTAGAALLVGDCFAFDNGSYREMHMLTQNATADGAGAATLHFTPAIRRSPADNAAILLNGHDSNEATRMAAEVITISGTEADWQSQGFQMNASPKFMEMLF